MSNTLKSSSKTFIDAFEKILVQLMNSVAGLLMSPGSPFRVICNMVEWLKEGMCAVLTTSWVPTGMNIYCGRGQDGKDGEGVFDEDEKADTCD